MGVELYNKTNTVKLLPKFNYKGKFKLYPGKAHAIEDYMVSFYKPYEKIGITVRRTIDKSVIEKEVKKVIDKIEESIPEVEEVKTDNQESNSAESVNIEEVISTEGEERVEEVETPTTEVVNELTPNEKKIYSEEELDGLKIHEMKEILDSMGVSYEGTPNRRAEYAKLILSAQ